MRPILRPGVNCNRLDSGSDVECGVVFPLESLLRIHSVDESQKTFICPRSQEGAEQFSSQAE